MTLHSSSLAWRIPGMEEPGGLPSMGLHKLDMTEATQQQQQQISVLSSTHIPPFACDSALLVSPTGTSVSTSRVKHPVFLKNLLSSFCDPCVTKHHLPLLVIQGLNPYDLGIIPEDSFVPSLSNQSPSAKYPITYRRTKLYYVFRSEMAEGML